MRSGLVDAASAWSSARDMQGVLRFGWAPCCYLGDAFSRGGEARLLQRYREVGIHPCRTAVV